MSRPKRWVVLQEVLEQEMPSELIHLIGVYDGAGFSAADYKILGNNTFPVCKGMCEVEPGVYVIATESGVLHMYPSGKTIETDLRIYSATSMANGCYALAGKIQPLAVHTPDTLVPRLQIRNASSVLLQEIKCHFLSQGERVHEMALHDQHCLVIVASQSLTVLDVSVVGQPKFLKRTTLLYGPATVSNLIIAQRNRGLWRLHPSTWNLTKVHHPCVGHIKSICSTGSKEVFAIASRASTVSIVRFEQGDQAQIIQQIVVEGFVTSLASCKKTLLVATADGVVYVYDFAAPYTYNLVSTLTTHDHGQRVLDDSEEGPLTTKLFYSHLRLFYTQGGRLLGNRAGCTFLW